MVETKDINTNLKHLNFVKLAYIKTLYKNILKHQVNRIKTSFFIFIFYITMNKEIHFKQL